MFSPTLEGPLQNPERRDIAIEITHDSMTSPKLENQPLDDARSPYNDGVFGNEQPNAENTSGEEEGDGTLKRVRIKNNNKGGINNKKSTSHQ
jgi:hypothetical protein